MHISTISFTPFQCTGVNAPLSADTIGRLHYPNPRITLCVCWFLHYVLTPSNIVASNWGLWVFQTSLIFQKEMTNMTYTYMCCMTWSFQMWGMCGCIWVVLDINPGKWDIPYWLTLPNHTRGSHFLAWCRWWLWWWWWWWWWWWRWWWCPWQGRCQCR